MTPGSKIDILSVLIDFVVAIFLETIRGRELMMLISDQYKRLVKISSKSEKVTW